MINNISSLACGNVYSILSELNMLDKIPKKERLYLINHKENYELKFNRDEPLQFQVKDKETMVVLSYLYLKYINKDVDKKKYLLDRYKKNEILYQRNIRKKLNQNQLDTTIESNKKVDIINTEKAKDELALVEVKDNIIIRIIKKIKKIFIKK